MNLKIFANLKLNGKQLYIRRSLIMEVYEKIGNFTPDYFLHNFDKLFYKMSGINILLLLSAYFTLILIISYFTGRKNNSNDAFFLGNRKSKWYIVAFGMIGTSISGVTFISVPGLVKGIQFSYFQTVLGFFVGYFVVAFVLLPLYYRLQLTSIYTYLQKRLGNKSYKTGASFFILSRTVGAAARVYIAVYLLQTYVFDEFHVPFAITSMTIIFLIWLYTHRSGVKTIIWTDFLQTTFLLTALILIIIQVYQHLGMSPEAFFSTLKDSPHTKIFIFDNWISEHNFFKQFISGIFITIVVNGLDQDMMQKNLSCKNIKDAQKNMLTFAGIFVPINLLFLTLGAAMLILAQKQGIQLPVEGDKILPYFANHVLGGSVSVFFFIGIIAATFASADSALTALTTSFSIDILNIEKNDESKAKSTRMLVHGAFAILIALIVIIIHLIGNANSIVDTIYRIVSYTYGPLLGLFAFGLLTKYKVKDKFVPYIAILSPILIAVIDYTSQTYFNYKFGYELLLLNGLITFIGISLFTEKK
jgi:Na+/proline symporter